MLRPFIISLFVILASIFSASCAEDFASSQQQDKVGGVMDDDGHAVFNEEDAPELECFHSKMVEVNFADYRIDESEFGVTFYTPNLKVQDVVYTVFDRKTVEYEAKYNKSVVLHFYVEQSTYIVLNLSEPASLTVDGWSAGTLSGSRQIMFSLQEGETRAILTWENPFCDGYIIE